MVQGSGQSLFLVARQEKKLGIATDFFFFTKLIHRGYTQYVSDQLLAKLSVLDDC